MKSTFPLQEVQEDNDELKQDLESDILSLNVMSQTIAPLAKRCKSRFDFRTD